MTHVHQVAKAAKTVAEQGMMEHGMMKGMTGMGMGTGHLGAMVGGAAGTLVAASSHNTGKGIIHKLARHPLVMFGLGLTAGYLIHKYRKEIIASATHLGEQGKDFVLQQRENLEDLVAECKECEDDAGNTGNSGTAPGAP